MVNVVAVVTMVKEIISAIDNIYIYARREGVFYISSSEVLWKITVFQLVNNYLLCCAFLRSAFVVV